MCITQKGFEEFVHFPLLPCSHPALTININYLRVILFLLIIWFCVCAEYTCLHTNVVGQVSSYCAVVVMAGGATEQREKTDTKKKSAEPVWNKEMSLYVYTRSRYLYRHAPVICIDMLVICIDTLVICFHARYLYTHARYFYTHARYLFSYAHMHTHTHAHWDLIVRIDMLTHSYLSMHIHAWLFKLRSSSSF